MVSIAREPIKKLIGYAVRAEMDSNKVYLRLSGRVKNPLLKEKFQLLAFEEKKHKEKGCYQANSQIMVCGK